METDNYIGRTVEWIQKQVLPLPDGWWEAGMLVSGIALSSTSLLAIVSINPWVPRKPDLESETEDWLHVSLSRLRASPPSAMPTWEQMAEVKDLIIGPEREALQVIPKLGEHYSIAEVAHLWHRLEGGPVCPNFTHGGTL